MDLHVLTYDILDGHNNTNKSDNPDSTEKPRKKCIIRMFGRDISGKSHTVTVHGFEPYFYILLPIPVSSPKELIRSTAGSIMAKLNYYIRDNVADSLVSCNVVKREDVYGFQADTKKLFIKIVCDSTGVHNNYIRAVANMNALHARISAYQEYSVRPDKAKSAEIIKSISETKGYKVADEAKLFLKGDIQKIVKALSHRSLAYQLTLYESNIPPILRFIHNTEIEACNWVHLSKFVRDPEAGLYTTDNAVVCDITDVAKNGDMCNEKVIAKFIEASFDIEASSSHGQFPLPKKTYRELIFDLCEHLSRNNRFNQKMSSPEVLNVTGNYNIPCVPTGNVFADGPDYVRSIIKQCFNDSPERSYDLRSIYTKPHRVNIDKQIGIIAPITYILVCYLLHYKQLQKTDNTASASFAKYTDKLDSILSDYLPPVEGDKCIQIGLTYKRVGENNCYKKVIFTLAGCDPIPAVDSVVPEVYSFDKEEDVIIAHSKMIQEDDIDIILGYNTDNFDWKFLYLRACELGIVQEFLTLTRYRGKTAKYTEQTLESAAFGKNLLCFVEPTGRLQLDLYRVISSDPCIKLSSFKLDAVAAHFMRGKITGGYVMSGHNQTVLFTDGTGQLREGDFITIQTNKGAYEEPALLPDQFIVQKELLEGETPVVTSKYRISKIYPDTGVLIISGEYQLDFAEYSGGCFWCEGKDDISPEEIFRFQKGSDADRAKIAKYCIQDCVLCNRLMNRLDIFTTRMSMANVCCIPIQWVFSRGQGIKILSLFTKQSQLENKLLPTLEAIESEESYDGAIVLKPKKKIYISDDEIVAVLDFNSLYPSCMISEDISHDTIVLDPKYLNLPGYTYNTIVYPTYDRETGEVTGEQSVIYASTPGKKGIIPRVLQNLLQKRADCRVEQAKTKDPFRWKLLDGDQLAYKVVANSVYGSTGAGTSAIRCTPLAASTTATGRKNLLFAKDEGARLYGCDTVYGDTDSIFVIFPKELLVDCDSRASKIKKVIQLAKKLGKEISVQLKSPHNLEFEKAISPFILVSKKRYVGKYFTKEDNPDYFYVNSMGLELKRRDNAPIVKQIYGEMINIIMKYRDLEMAKEYLRKSILDVLEGKIPFERFVLSKNLNVYTSASPPAHKVLADRMADRDPGSAPAINSRLPYAYITNKTIKENPDIKQGERIEHPDFILKNKLKLDYMFYVTNQIQVPISRILVLEYGGFGDLHDKKFYEDGLREVDRVHFLPALRDKRHKEENIQSISTFIGSTTQAAGETSIKKPIKKVSQCKVSVKTQNVGITGGLVTVKKIIKRKPKVTVKANANITTFFGAT